jgi:hypothetical protein
MPGLSTLAASVQRLAYQQRTLPHQLNFFFIFQDHHSANIVIKNPK